MCNIKVSIAIAIFGMFAGFSAALCFGLEYYNYTATTMAIFSGISATILLYVHLAFLKGWMLEWPPARFTCYIWAGWVICVLSGIGMVGSLVYAGVHHQTLTSEGIKGENFWITSVWFFMVSKWTSLIALYAKRYQDATTLPLSKTPPIAIEKEKALEKELQYY
ncbi:hypothetical protein Aduo_019593 [Ancylostoma duodenale]